VYEEGDVTVLWNQAVHTDRDATANRPDTIIKNTKEKTCTLIYVSIPVDRKEAEKLKYKSLGIETTNVEPEMYDYTSYNWSHWNSNEKLKEKPESYTGKTFGRFTTADSCTWNISHNTESTAV
jgi:hypothetical protein